MRSDLEKFFDVASRLLLDLREQAGAFAWVVLGVMLAVGLVVAFLALRWVRQGGLGAGGTQKFWADRRVIAQWLRRR